ncbi:MAG: hypothetical protein COB22_03040, partial [Cycloclasticus sp.]
MANIGTVQSVTGIVKAIAEDGTERILSVGDSVAENEKIITTDGAIVIAFNDGTVMDLGSFSSIVLNDEALAQEQDQHAAQSQTDAENEVAALQDALANNPNFDPTTALPATAAGAPAAGTDGNNGHTVVSVDYLDPRAPVTAGFDTVGINVEFPETDPELPPVEDPPSISINDTHECEPGSERYEQYISKLGPAPDNFEDGIAVFTVTLSKPFSETVTVEFQTADGTAIAGGVFADGEQDYDPNSGTVTFLPGETEAFIYVYVNYDEVNESDENFFVNLSNPDNATIADGQGEGIIIDKTDLTVSLAASSTVAEDIGTVTYTVTQDGTSTADTL